MNAYPNGKTSPWLQGTSGIMHIDDHTLQNGPSETVDFKVEDLSSKDFSIKNVSASSDEQIIDDKHMDKTVKPLSEMTLLEKLKNGPPHYKFLALFLLAPKSLIIFAPGLIRKYVAPACVGVDLLLIARVILGVSAWVAYKRYGCSGHKPFADDEAPKKMTTTRFAKDAMKTLAEFAAIYAAIFAGGYLWENYIRVSAEVMAEAQAFAATSIPE